MSHLNAVLAKELYEMGFSFYYLQNNPQKGMAYYYNEREWIIGGDIEENFTVNETTVIQNGIWLPSTDELIDWLQNNKFIFNIYYPTIENMGIYVNCIDSITEREYNTEGPLPMVLGFTIKKILKKAERPFDINEPEWYPIINK